MPGKPRSTSVWRVDSSRPDPEVMRRAGLILREGGLVAFPTETVYGLGANALDAAAVGEIFAAKNRPADNPLIVHLDSPEKVHGVAGEITPAAGKLMHAFWPGPLTLVLPGRSNLPAEVTCGLDTVAVRVPGHAVALALIREAGVPVAAPSANASGRPSPTTAGHVKADLEGSIDVVIDAGPAGVGVESTVVDVTGEVPVILRPGGVTPREVEEAAGAVQIYAGAGGETGEDRPRSPGLLHKHYSPRTPLLLVEGDYSAMDGVIKKLVLEYKKEGKKVGILCPEESAGNFPGMVVKKTGSRENTRVLAQNLYRALRELDAAGLDIIIAEGTGESELGLAVMNRLRRAADEIIQV